jgi:hypothetical protein
MSLLDHGPGYEPCTVFPEELVKDKDGNDLTRPSAEGIPAEARFQIQGQSGTSSRRQEQDNEGFESEKVYKIRFKRSFPYVLGAQSQIEWNGVRWALFGDVARYNGSRRTRHQTYTIKRY